MSTKYGNITRILSCEVFKPALESFHLEQRCLDLRLTYLPSNLHLRPQELRNHLLKEIHSAQERDERIICLYGYCFPGIEYSCKQHGVTKVPGHYCYEMLLGSERFRQIMDEAAGTYFLERDLILNFKSYCIDPLKLYEERMRKLCFKNYQRLLYVRQPSDPDLLPKARKLAELLELSLEIRDADYSHLETALSNLI